jgi:acetyl esterase
VTKLRQPFRAVLALSEVMLNLGVGPTRAKVVAQPAERRQLSKPPFWMTRPGDPAVRTYDQLVAGRGGPVRVRVFVPPGVTEGSPVIVYLHGGGFVMGGLDGCDYVTRGLASRTGFPVVSVEYRLAPECPFPGPLEDCEDALRWVAETCPEGIDASRIGVAGDSAGGNLAAALCLLVRDNSGPTIAHQTLIYPFTDGSLSSPSWATHSGGGIDVDAGADMLRYYAPNHAVDHPLVSPLHAPDLSGLPPALVITAEFDVLHHDGRDYAERLSEAAVPVVYRDYPGIPHGFVTMPRLCRDSDDALDLVAGEVRAALGS